MRLEGVGEGAGGTEKHNGGAPGHLPLQVTSGAVCRLATVTRQYTMSPACSESRGR